MNAANGFTGTTDITRRVIDPAVLFSDAPLLTGS
jgi:hypothetical protein